MSSAIIDFNDSHLYYTCCIIVLCPLLWNILARLIHMFLPKNTSTSTRYLICYSLMLWIFSLSSYRDYLIRKTIQNQPKLIMTEDYSNFLESIAIGIFLLGQLFVLSSFYKLGITGTFLGDYCGILMNAPVTTFPFNILNNPMYIGSTLSFFALALYYMSPVGILLTIEVYLVYQIALLFEEPYTKRIYEQKNK
jgi:phosphatidylethanolamine N-methyltransferase